MKRVGGVVLVVTGVLACPCHLAFTLPLVLTLLGGTALGRFLAGNTGLAAGLATVYFVGALWLGLALLSRGKNAVADACATCVPSAAGAAGEQPAADPVAAGQRAGSNR